MLTSANWSYLVLARCVSQDLECFSTCGSRVAGHMDENVMDAVPNLGSEYECKERC